MELAAAPTDARLSITPPIEASDGAFLAGFSRHAISSHGRGASSPARRVARIWPGQPAVPSPWVPCSGGCCLMLASTHARVDTAGQWLRFLIAEFLGDQHQVNGRVEVPGVMGRRGVLLIVEAGEVFEGELADEAERGRLA